MYNKKIWNSKLLGQDNVTLNFWLQFLENDLDDLNLEMPQRIYFEQDGARPHNFDGVGCDGILEIDGLLPMVLFSFTTITAHAKERITLSAKLELHQRKAESSRKSMQNDNILS
ncbi:hypothetical protein FQR65_LT11923 [Abscondita terminalis]|nr:hypothetical protein FQR65_LT11923 [Abscondita terminalis]